MKNTLLFKRVVILLLFISAGYIGYIARNGSGSAANVPLEYRQTNRDTAANMSMVITIANITTAANVTTSINHADLPCWGVQEWGETVYHVGGIYWAFCWEGYAIGIWNHCWHGPDKSCWDGHDVACRYDGNERWQDCYGHYTGSKFWIQWLPPNAH